MSKPDFPAELPAGVAFPELDPRFAAAPPTAAPTSAAPSHAPPPVADPDGLVIDFTPVPRLRVRRNGWTEARQRAFIAALARCGSVAAAARGVGMTKRSAYRLLESPGGASFAEAWDTAVDLGGARVQIDALERSLKGEYVPIYRRGKLVRVEHRRNDRMAIALLSGNKREVEEYRRTAASRHEYVQDMGALDSARRERIARIQAAEDAYEAECSRLIGVVIERCEARPRGEPSIRQL